jgi:hypothetical protein
MHWPLDVEFKDDLSQYRSAHGPRTWLSCVASRLARLAPTKAREASKLEENQPAETQTTFSNCYSSAECQPGLRAVGTSITHDSVAGCP